MEKGCVKMQDNEMANDIKLYMNLVDDIINRLKDKNDRLKKEKDNLIKTYKDCMVEAIEDFVTRLKAKATEHGVADNFGGEIYTVQYVFMGDIDDTLAELTDDLLYDLLTEEKNGGS